MAPQFGLYTGNTDNLLHVGYFNLRWTSTNPPPSSRTLVELFFLDVQLKALLKIASPVSPGMLSQPEASLYVFFISKSPGYLLKLSESVLHLESLSAGSGFSVKCWPAAAVADHFSKSAILRKRSCAPQSNFWTRKPPSLVPA